MQRLNMWTVVRYTYPATMYSTITPSYMSTLAATSNARVLVEDTATSTLWVVGTIYVSSTYYQLFTNIDKVTGTVLYNTGTSWGANSDVPQFKTIDYAFS